jgi:hypothetical protein
MVKPKKNVKKKADVTAMDAEDKIRDLINQIKIYNEEELEMGEGKKIEDDAAEYLIEKLRDIARTIGIASIK